MEFRTKNPAAAVEALQRGADCCESALKVIWPQYSKQRLETRNDQAAQPSKNVKNLMEILGKALSLQGNLYIVQGDREKAIELLQRASLYDKSALKSLNQLKSQ